MGIRQKVSPIPLLELKSLFIIVLYWLGALDLRLAIR
jgi:hypothetical protein